MGRAPYLGIEKSRIIYLNPPKSKIDFFRQGLGGESPWYSALSLPLAAAWVCGVLSSVAGSRAWTERLASDWMLQAEPMALSGLAQSLCYQLAGN